MSCFGKSMIMKRGEVLFSTIVKGVMSKGEQPTSLSMKKQKRTKQLNIF